MRSIARTLGLALLVVSCSSAVPDATTTTVASVPLEPSQTLLAVGDLLDDEGLLTIEGALQLFSTLVEPIAGVEPLDLGDSVPLDLADVAVRKMEAVRSDLDPGAVEALDRLLVSMDEGEDLDVDMGRARVIELVSSDGPLTDLTEDNLPDRVADIVATFEEFSGHRLAIPVTVRLGGSTAFARPVGDPDRPAGCRILLPPSTLSMDAASALSTLAHEVWHCFQLDANPAAFDGGPTWMIEGQAEWAGESLVGGSASSSGRWNTWLLSFNQSLWRRSYDAIGIYAVASQNGGDPWSTMLRMLGRGNLAAVETLFGGAADQAVLVTAENLVRAPAVGSIWESSGPGITTAQGAPVLALVAGAPVEARATVGRFSVLPVVLAVSAGGDVLRIQVNGGSAAAIQLPEAGFSVMTPGSTARFCMLPEGCTCPDGTFPGGEELPPAAPGEGAVGIGSLDGGVLSVVGEFTSLEDECRSLVGTWTTDAASQMATLMAAFGAGEGPDCNGPYVLNFGADGSFTGQYNVECRIPDGSSVGSAVFTGTYTDTGDTFAVANIEGSGSMTISVSGFSQTMDLFPGFRQGFSTPTSYMIENDVLTYEYAGTSFSFTRSG